MRPAGIRKLDHAAQIFDVEKFKCPNIKEQYHQRLQDGIGHLAEPCDWESIADTCRKTAKEVLGPRQNKRKPWIKDKTWQAIEERRELRLRLSYEQDIAEKARLKEQYALAERMVKKFAKRDRKDYTEEVAAEAQFASNKGDLRAVYSAIGKLANSKKSIPPLIDRDGKIITTDDGQLNCWADYFENITNVETDGVNAEDDGPRRRNPNRSISTDTPTESEIAEAMGRLKSHKSAGADGIQPELLKYGADVLAIAICPIIREIWNSGEIPSMWKDGIIVTLPKKGNLGYCANWRGITLLNTIQKVLAFIILNRISSPLNEQLRNEQNGFRPGRSCVDHINTTRILIEQSVEWRSPLFLLFVDFERAFDTIKQNSVWSCLKRRGVPQKIVDLIKSLYRDADCSVRFKGKLSRKFKINAGVRQGCVLSPLLFITVLDEVLQKTNEECSEGIQWTPFEKLSDLDYADDICLMTHSLQGVKNKLEVLAANASRKRLNINFKKTKLLRVQTTDTNPLYIGIGNSTIKIDDVDEFCYLGSMVSKNGGTDHDVDARINKARQAFYRLHSIWRTSAINKQTKIRVFNTCVVPVLLYGAETWRVARSTTHKLQVFVNKCLRRIQKIFWPNKVSNEELWRICNTRRIDTVIKQRKWSWIGHTLRKGNDDIAKRALEWNPQGSRRRGRPALTWIRSVQLESQHLGTWNQIRSIAQMEGTHCCPMLRKECRLAKEA